MYGWTDLITVTFVGHASETSPRFYTNRNVLKTYKVYKDISKEEKTISHHNSVSVTKHKSNFTNKFRIQVKFG